MKIITKPIGGGKTTELIKLSAETRDTIVCLSSAECARIYKVAASELNLDIPMPITYNEFLKYKQMGNDKKGVLIDNLDGLLYYINRGFKVNGISVTSKDNDCVGVTSA